MSDYSIPVAVFDLDGTITRRDTYVRFLLLCLRCMPARLLKTPLLFWSLLLHKAGLRSNHWLKARFLGLIVGGVSPDKLKALAKRFSEVTVLDDLKSGAIAEIQDLKSQGYKIVIATASFSFYVEYLAEALKADELLCSVARLDASGRITGELEGLNCIGVEKARRVQDLLTERGWSHVQRAYSDHKVDLPLLKMSSVAVVVDPKPATASVAGEYGYQIVRW